MEEKINKLRGGYYTPQDVTRFITEWAIQNRTSKILEPSCGDGHFVKDIVERLLFLGATTNEIKRNVFAVELYEEEAKKASEYGSNVICGDFFGIFKDTIKGKIKFDAIVGNPPFIRYQNFDEKYRKCAFSLAEEVGLHLTRLSNIWLPFLILCCEALDENYGRLGMVIPAELFKVDYAAEARKYLSEKFEHLQIITFKKLLFEGTQQEVVLLLGECRSPKKGIEVIEVEDASELTANIFERQDIEVKKLDHSVDKWTKYFLSNEELELLRRLENRKGIIPTTQLFEVNVGVVSGQNKFFITDHKTVVEYGLENSVQPIIGRSEQLDGVILDAKDLKALEESNKKIFLFVPNEDKPTSTEMEYIKIGEQKNYHKGYKCSIRKKWYIVPQSWMPDAFLLRQINKYPKMVMNFTDATNTDTLHKIRFLEGINGSAVTLAFLNSYTFALSEITGRSYGGGVMTFEPGEIRKLKIPMIHAEKLNLMYVDELMREKNIEGILDYTDKILLEDGLGLTKDEIFTLRGIWKKLSDRRLYRKTK